MKPSGVLSGVDSAPWRTNSSRSAAVRSPRTMSPCSCSTTRRGVPLGATMPDQVSTCEIGRASWRERVEISVVAVSLKKQEGIGDVVLTGVQTCALPIYDVAVQLLHHSPRRAPGRDDARPGVDLRDRKSVVEGKSGDLGGGRIIKKTRGNRRCSVDWSSDVCSSDLRCRRAAAPPLAAACPWARRCPTRCRPARSEERRGGKEWRSRWWPYH